jgi:hypothetical protein
VTGFGLPAQRGHIHAHDRAGVRKPPGKEGAGLGHPAQRALWGFGGRRRVQRVPVEVSIGHAGERLGVDLGLRSSEPGVSHADRAQIDVGTGLVGRASSSPAVNQQHDRSALMRESGAIGVMTCRS